MVSNLSRRDFLKYAAGAGVATVVISTGLEGYAYAQGSGTGGAVLGLGSGTVPEQIHLTWGADSSTEITVSWLSPNQQASPQLTLTPEGASPVTYSGSQVTALNYTDTLSGEQVWCYHAPLTGLTPGATYTYAIEDAGATSPVSFSSEFTMAQSGRFAYTFSSYGDLATPGAGATYTWAGESVSSTTYSESQWNAYSAVGEVESQAPLFHLLNGDLAYADKEAMSVPSGDTPVSGYAYQPAPEVWRDFGLNMQRSAANRPWMPTIGNHETELGDQNYGGGNGPNGYASFNSRYLVPANGTPYSGNFYSFTVGSILFICLDANDVTYQGSGAYSVINGNIGTNASPTYTSYSYQAPNGTNLPPYAATYNRQYTGAFGTPSSTNGPLPAGSNAQTVWLENTLAGARTAGGDIDWIVVTMHQCACSSSSDNGSDLGIRQAWLSLFFEYGVDLVLNGHDHCYERTFPLNGFAQTAQGLGQWAGGTVYVNGTGGTAQVPANTGQAVQTLTPVPVPGTTTGSPNGATYTWTSGLPSQTGTIFMTLGGGGTDKRDNTYEAAGKAQVTTFTQVRTGGQGFVINGTAQAPGTKPTPDTMETQTWSAVRDSMDAYGIAMFAVDPGISGATTSLTVNYYHAGTQTNTGSDLPAPSYSPYDSFTIVRPRSDSPTAGLPEFSKPALALAATVAAAGGAGYVAHRRASQKALAEPNGPPVASD